VYSKIIILIINITYNRPETSTWKLPHACIRLLRYAFVLLIISPRIRYSKTSRNIQCVKTQVDEILNRKQFIVHGINRIKCVKNSQNVI